jgi:hypothetical protein
VEVDGAPQGWLELLEPDVDAAELGALHGATARRTWLMTRTLNHDVLKRTTGLLSEIDYVVSLPSVAERVDRVIQSAARCSNSGYMEVRDEESEDGLGLVPSFEFTESSDGCDYNCRCGDAYPDKLEPIEMMRAPYSGSIRHAAVIGCGIEDCECDDLFPLTDEELFADVRSSSRFNWAWTWGHLTNCPCALCAYHWMLVRHSRRRYYELHKGVAVAVHLLELFCSGFAS